MNWTSALKSLRSTRLLHATSVATFSVLLPACTLAPAPLNPATEEASRIQAADELIARGKYEEAYDILDTAVWRGAPGWKDMAIARIMGDPRVRDAATGAIAKQMIRDSADLDEAAYASEAAFYEAMKSKRDTALGMIGRAVQINPALDRQRLQAEVYTATRTEYLTRKRETEYHQAIWKNLELAEAAARVECNDRATCDKAFTLAQIFVSDRADMKIQVATDAVIETYNPTETGKVGMKVVRIPGRGESYSIRLTVVCHLKSDTSDRDFKEICARRKTMLYEAFPRYLKGAL